MSERFDVLAFGAHPDDAEAACGGLLVQLVRQGYRVAICDLTRGELASNGTVAERRAEAEAAARVLGLHGRLDLGLPDGGLHAEDPEQRRCIVATLRTHVPRLILIPDLAARHPDHLAAHALLRQAQFFCGVAGYDAGMPPVERPVLVRALDFHPMVPSFVVDVSAVLPLKLEALRCYRSQFEPGPGRVPTLLNDPAYLQRVETNARTYGQLIGCTAGEPYAVDGPVPLVDPVAALVPAGKKVP